MARTASTKRNSTNAPNVKVASKRTTKRTPKSDNAPVSQPSPEAVRLFLEGIDRRRQSARTSFQAVRDQQVHDTFTRHDPLAVIKHVPYRNPSEISTHEAFYLFQLCELSEELLQYQFTVNLNEFFSAFSILSQALTNDKAVVERLMSAKMSTRISF